MALGGAPGLDDRVWLSEWQAANGIEDIHADPDADGLTSFMNFVYGGTTPPRIEIQRLRANNNEDDYLTITYYQNAAAEEVTIEPEISSDLLNWSRFDHVFISRHWEEGAVEKVMVRSRAPVPANAELFVRLRLTGPSP